MKRPTLRTRKFPSVENVLGGKGVLGAKTPSSLDWVGIIREGIPAAAVESIVSAARLSRAELARALGIPERTAIPSPSASFRTCFARAATLRA
jgi:uncharacterized protein (DUF2384 family)